jgi:hypothetical protein
MPQFTLVSMDDWQALYDGDQKVIEGHRVELQDVLRALKVEDRIELRSMHGTPQEDHCNYYGDVPESLEDLMELKAPAEEENHPANRLGFPPA